MRLAGLVLLAWTALTSAATRTVAAEVDISYEKFTLDNGLRVIVHQDRKAPIVAVQVWYHTGSKNEPAGRTGFAHLFEHLMFEGSENFDEDYSVPFDAVGATQMNGSTWFDRTNYFENVPTPALELALWLESDRMGHLLGAVTQEKLDQERGVVQNEKRQWDDQPYSLAWYQVLEGVFPPGHPYRHDTIGTMEDLEAASLEDVRQWFRDYYGAANTVLVLAGDIDPQRGRQLAEKYFGDIPSGPPITRMQRWIPEQAETVRETMYDRVPQTRSFRYWAVPGWNETERVYLELAASVLGDGKNSRLYQALIYESQLAVEVEVAVDPFEIASLFSIDVTLADGSNLRAVDDIVEQETARFLQWGPHEEELQRARSSLSAEAIRGLESVGGFSGKAAALAQGELYDGNPAFYQTRLDWLQQASADDVRAAAARWLGGGSYQLDVLPWPEYETAATTVDRSKGLPAVGAMPDLEFPSVERTRLDNGLNIVLAERHSLPVVNLSIQFDAGYAADSGRLPGTASFALAMMDEGTTNRSALEIEAEADALGAVIGTDSDLDTSRVVLSALADKLPDSLALFADVVRNPAFPAEELERQRQRWLATIEREQSDPLDLALRTLPPLIYGSGHAYGIPFTGSGTRDGIGALTAQDLADFHGDWIRPDNATLFVVGDVTMEQLLPLVEQQFGSWQPPEQPVPTKAIATVDLPPGPRLLLIDKPDATQSVILAAHLAPPTGVENNVDIFMMNGVLGSDYLSRINQNLRVDKHWSYGAYTLLPNARGQRPFMVYAPVETAHTVDAVRELVGEIERFVANDPAHPDELERVYRSNAYALPGQFESSGAVIDMLEANVRFGRPDDYAASLKTRYEQVQLESLQAAADEVLHPDRLTWVIVGDRKAIEQELRALNLAQVELLDGEGQPLTP